MLTTKLNNTTIILYTGIKELPIERYKAFQNYMLQESGIGNDMASIDRHLQNSINFLVNNKADACKEELTNLRYSFFSMITGISYKTRAFACLVSQINDIQCNDISSDGLSNVIELIEKTGTNNEQIETLWESVKKNFITN